MLIAFLAFILIAGTLISYVLLKGRRTH